MSSLPGRDIVPSLMRDSSKQRGETVMKEQTKSQIYGPTETQEIQLASVNPLDIPNNVFQSNLDRRKQNRHILIEWIRSAMLEGVDYGSIMIKGKPSKPSLFKPGAEKICGMLGLIPVFPNLEQYEGMALAGREVKLVILKCELHNQGQVVAHGIGARIVDHQDRGDVNKSLKMAAKSSTIDATLRCAGLSEIFTQDIEDMEASQVHVPLEKRRMATDRQIQYIGSLCDQIYDQESKTRMALHLAAAYEAQSMMELTKDQASELIEYLLAGKELEGLEEVPA